VTILPSSPDRKRPLLEHLEEIRRRLLRIFLWAGLGTAIVWHYAHSLLAWLIRPVGQVVFTRLTEPFLVHLKVAFLGGILLASPLIAWECWSFIRPAVKKTPARFALIFLALFSALLFLAGAWFGWIVLVPSALKVLLAFGADFMTPMIGIGDYLSFVSWLAIGCGLIFQTPLVILFLATAGVVRPATLLKHWRAAVVVILLIAAVLTPTPDVVSQLLMAAPLFVLYFFSVGIAILFQKTA
jgi:sec-independent protein translocase protein TatC